MSAILSADDLNDFISPGVACIKPVETLPPPAPASQPGTYEVTRDDLLDGAAAHENTAQISLTDCLACSGCVTSAEAVLVSLQSHNEVVDVLNRYWAFDFDSEAWCDKLPRPDPEAADADAGPAQSRVFVASVSAQTRASLAATFGISEIEAGHMVEQLLCGPEGLRSKGSGFAWTVDVARAREACLALEVEQQQLMQSGGAAAGTAAIAAKKPVLSSSCPGWICYAEKTHPHILPHLSRLKSPQALLGTMLKTSLSRALDLSPDRIWHLAVMPCFDKKLEASREELTDLFWDDTAEGRVGVRDVDCVITTAELLKLAQTKGIDFTRLPRTPLSKAYIPPFPNKTLASFLFPPRKVHQNVTAGTSGGYLSSILEAVKALNAGSAIKSERGRNADVVEYSVVAADGSVLMKAARYYGFRNIQNLVRKLKPLKASRLPGARIASRKAGGASDEYAYVEVMACPGGCTNGGGQIKLGDVNEIRASTSTPLKEVANQREWLAQVDEAYFSADSDNETESLAMTGNSSNIKEILEEWSRSVDIPLEKLVTTSFREVVSDVGKDKSKDMERVVSLASKLGGGW